MELNDLITEMQAKGSITIERIKCKHQIPDTIWLDEAIKQENRNVSKALIDSYLERYDLLDKRLGLRHDPHRFDGTRRGRFVKKIELEFGLN